MKALDDIYNLLTNLRGQSRHREANGIVRKMRRILHGRFPCALELVEDRLGAEIKSLEERVEGRAGEEKVGGRAGGTHSDPSAVAALSSDKLELVAEDLRSILRQAAEAEPQASQEMKLSYADKVRLDVVRRRVHVWREADSAEETATSVLNAYMHQILPAVSPGELEADRYATLTNAESRARNSEVGVDKQSTLDRI